jgi:hypothetical protein
MGWMSEDIHQVPLGPQRRHLLRGIGPDAARRRRVGGDHELSHPATPAALAATSFRKQAAMRAENFHSPCLAIISAKPRPNPSEEHSIQ